MDMRLRRGSYDNPMPAWICPQCDRSFGRRNQSHTCVPSGTVDGYFSGRPPVQREVCDTITNHLQSLGPVVVDAVQVCIMFKRSRTFAEVRAKRDSVSLWVLLSRTCDSPRFTRVVRASRNRTAHFINLRTPDDIDDEVLDWLAESYFDSPE